LEVYFLKVKFIGHASILVSGSGYSILCDPWFEGRAFNNAWELWPGPVKLSLQEFSLITHIWISHEHPDHLHFQTLKSIFSFLNDNVFIIFQKLNSPKVISALKKIGFKNFILPAHMNKIDLLVDVSIFVYQHRHLDSALILVDRNKILMNLNDAELSELECLKLKSIFGAPEILLTQFSIAGSSGIVKHDLNSSKNALEKFIMQGRILSPKYHIPFASFVRFCAKDNFHLNKHVVKINDIRLLYKKTKIYSMFPGSVLDTSCRPAKADNALRKFKYFYKKNETNKFLYSDPPIKLLEIQDAIKTRISKWKKSYPKFLFKKIGVIHFFIQDLNVTLKVDFNSSLIATSNIKFADFLINSQPLWFAFFFDFGVQTLGVSGRYKILNFDAYERWKVIRIISSLYNAEIYCNIKSIFNKANLKWIWNRRSNFLLNIFQQYLRFFKA
jgi:UDP-MurNAc hydroxylase